MKLIHFIILSLWSVCVITIGKISFDKIEKKKSLKKQQITEDKEILVDNLNLWEESNDEKEYFFYHFVEDEGETIKSIARKYNIGIDILCHLNSLKENQKFKEGEIIKVPSTKGIVYKVRRGDNLSKIAHRFSIKVSDIKLANNLISSFIREGDVLFLPNAKPKTYSDKLIYSKERKYKLFKRFIRAKKEKGFITQAKEYTSDLVEEFKESAEGFIRPVEGKITSFYGSRRGRFHNGIDIQAKWGGPIKATKDGKVVFAGYKGGYGKCVIIDHGGGFKTLYAHASQLTVSEGQWVSQGQIIGFVGASGNATGPHLHFSIFKDGKSVNPLNHLPF